MTVVDSTATLSELRTAPPVHGKDLTTVFTDNPAPRPDGKNLLIKIEVGADQAQFDCLQQEHAGAHKQRHVLFEANKDCWLIFTNKSVFTEEYLELRKNEATPAWISDSTQGAQTDFIVRVQATKTAKQGKVVKMKAAAVPQHGPVIVVP